jgi:hypothetical protein
MVGYQSVLCTSSVASTESMSCSYNVRS